MHKRQPRRARLHSAESKCNTNNFDENPLDDIFIRATANLYLLVQKRAQLASKETNTVFQLEKVGDSIA